MEISKSTDIGWLTTINDRLASCKDYSDIERTMNLTMKTVKKQIEFLSFYIYEIDEQTNRLNLLIKSGKKEQIKNLVPYVFPLHVRDKVFAILKVTSQNELNPAHCDLLRMVASLLSGGLFQLKLSLESRTDPLLGIFNRGHFEKLLDQEIIKSSETNQMFCLIMLDLDDFKKVNDNYGHPAGDQLLIKVAQKTKEVVGISGTVARYGGEEYSIILPNKKIKEANSIAEKIRSAIEKIKIVYENRGPINVTCSQGIAMYPGDGEEGEDLKSAADKALYLAKMKGKNKVVSYEDVASLGEKNLEGLEQEYGMEKFDQLIVEYYEDLRGKFTDNFRITKRNISLNIKDPKGKEALQSEERSMYALKPNIDSFLQRYVSDPQR